MAQVPSNILAEHQGLDSDKAPGYNPTEEETRAIKLVERLYTEAKRYRARYDHNWLENDRFFRGQQWKDKRPSYRHSEVINYVFSEIQSVLVLLTDNRPTIETLPEDPTDYEFSEIINQVLISKWDVNNWSYVVAEAIIDAARYGTAIGTVPWKPEAADGLGDYVFETVDPFYFYPDPNTRAKLNDEYCGYTIEAVPTSVSKLKKEYPEVADFLVADLSDLALARNIGDQYEEIELKSPIDNRVSLEQTKGSMQGKPNQALKICLYLKSDEVEQKEVDEQVDPETGLGTKLYQSQLKYPTGRKIVVVNGVLCEDGPNYDENGKLPYARFVDHIMPREFWGIGEVEQMKSPQVIVNKLTSYLLDVLILMGNPIWVVDTASGVDTNNLTNQPGLVVEKNPNTEVRREPGVELQPFVMDALQHFSERVMTKLGSTNETSKGVSPGGNPSGYAIEQLQEAAQTKLRGKSRNLEIFLKEVGDLMVDRILQFYTLPRIVRLTNNEGAAEYFKFHITATEDEMGETQKVATVQEYLQDQTTGQHIPQAPREIPIKSRLDVRMSTGSSLPFAKVQKSVTAERLYDKGILDAEEFLTTIEWPNRERIIKKLQEQAQAAAQQQAMQPQGDPNAAPPTAA